MIKADPKKSFEIMGADVKQTAEQFENSQKYLRWQDRAANQKFFAGEHAPSARKRPTCCWPPASSGDSGPDEAGRHALHQVSSCQSPQAYLARKVRSL
jgi:hypothetical protein